MNTIFSNLEDKGGQGLGDNVTSLAAFSPGRLPLGLSTLLALTWKTVSRLTRRDSTKGVRQGRGEKVTLCYLDTMTKIISIQDQWRVKFNTTE